MRETECDTMMEEDVMLLCLKTEEEATCREKQETQR